MTVAYLGATLWYITFTKVSSKSEVNFNRKPKHEEKLVKMQGSYHLNLPSGINFFLQPRIFSSLWWRSNKALSHFYSFHISNVFWAEVLGVTEINLFARTRGCHWETQRPPSRKLHFNSAFGKEQARKLKMCKLKSWQFKKLRRWQGYKII